jgi:hypothetical protein
MSQVVQLIEQGIVLILVVGGGGGGGSSSSSSSSSNGGGGSFGCSSNSIIAVWDMMHPRLFYLCIPYL